MVSTNRNTGEPRTTVGVRQATKDRLDQNRAPGQCYDGFLCQMIDLWEKTSQQRLTPVKRVKG